MASAGAPIRGVWRRSPLWGPGAEPLVRGSEGQSPLNAALKLKTVLLLDTQQTCRACRFSLFCSVHCIWVTRCVFKSNRHGIWVRGTAFPLNLTTANLTQDNRDGNPDDSVLIWFLFILVLIQFTILFFVFSHFWLIRKINLVFIILLIHFSSYWNFNHLRSTLVAWNNSVQF